MSGDIYLVAKQGRVHIESMYYSKTVGPAAPLPAPQVIPEPPPEK